MLTYELLKERLHYNPETGAFTRLYTLKNKGMTPKVGNITSAGYIQIKIGEKNYLAHRLAWFYVHGKWPNYEIDHINRNKTDNRITNLRDVERRVNCLNRKMKHNSAGALGVYKHRDRFYASFVFYKKSIYVGSFKTLEEAVDARSKALDAKTIEMGNCNV